MTSNRAEIEKMILGGWLSGEHLEDMNRISEKDFQSFRHIYRAIKAKGADVFGVSEMAKVTTVELMDMAKDYRDTFYQQAFAGLLEDKMRLYLKCAAETKSLIEIKKTLNKFEDAELEELPEPASHLCSTYWQELDRRANQKLVYTGLRSLDNLLCGIRTKELTSVGARPAVGKSAFTLQIATNVARSGEKVLYFPLEMSTMQTVERILLRYLDVSQRKLRKGDVDWKEMSVLADETVMPLEESGNFLIFEAVNDINVIKALIRRYKPKLVVIDQLEQMRCSTEKFKDKRERFSYMTNQLKRISMTEDVAVWLACQVNRDASQNEPTLSNLKESGSIEEDSDNVILLHRIPAEKMDSYGWDDNNRPMIVNVAKQRSGATGAINAQFIANKFTFYDLEG